MYKKGLSKNHGAAGQSFNYIIQGIFWGLFFCLFNFGTLIIPILVFLVFMYEAYDSYYIYIHRPEVIKAQLDMNYYKPSDNVKSKKDKWDCLDQILDDEKGKLYWTKDMIEIEKYRLVEIETWLNNIIYYTNIKNIDIHYVYQQMNQFIMGFSSDYKDMACTKLTMDSENIYMNYGYKCRVLKEIYKRDKVIVRLYNRRNELECWTESDDRFYCKDDIEIILTIKLLNVKEMINNEK